MDNDQLRAEADLLVHSCGLPELLEPYVRWFIGGSYNYGLMCWRDLDVYVLDSRHDLKLCFNVGYELSARLPAWKSRFTNNLGGEPNGFYWGIKLGDERKGAWKIDIWFLDQPSFDQHSKYC